jgi:putative transposase
MLLVPDGHTIHRDQYGPSQTTVASKPSIPVTNAVGALNSKLRRAVRARGHFPNDEAGLKLLFLVLNRTEKDWKMPLRKWTAVKAQMAIMSGERFSTAMSA